MSDCVTIEDIDKAFEHMKELGRRPPPQDKVVVSPKRYKRIQELMDKGMTFDKALWESYK